MMESECSGHIENNHTEMETETSSDPENGQTGDTKQDISSTNENTDAPFKKPGIFVAPSLTVKKPGGLNSTKKLTEEISRSISENKDTDRVTKHQQLSAKPTDTLTDPCDHPSSEKSEAHKVQPKPKDIWPKIPAKLPPAGNFPPLPYTEPPWGSVPNISYSFELLKNGAILDTVPLTQRSYFVVGRLPVCDVSLEHPSISRYHAVVQYRGRAGQDGVVGEEKGFYAYDLGSTHGTFVNKNKIPPKTYIRLRVGHVLKFGGSTRLFILQGPEFDEEAESDLTVTELRERARKQREELEKRMMGDGSDEEEEKEDSEASASRRSSSEEIGCSWGMAEEAMPEEDENEENPFATEFQEDQEAAYLKDPKKALQGFYDREGEELEFEYEEKGHGSWLCRIKLPVDDAMGRQLVAEVTHTGKKKEAAVQCCLEACRILEARGLLRQEAVSRKRKKKNWEDEDFYDSDDDTFLDRTGAVEKKRTERMKKAGKIQERPDTYESLLAKLAEVEKELADAEKRLSSSGRGVSSSSTEDPLDAFMSAVRSEAALDGVERKKLHLHVAELKKEGQRLRKLADLAKPTQLPSLQASSQDTEKPKKLSLPLFGAMKGGSKFKLKTGTIGTLPPKRTNLPPELFNMKEMPPGGEEEKEEEEEEEEEKNKKTEDAVTDGDMEVVQSVETTSSEHSSADRAETQTHRPNAKGDHKDQPAKIVASREKQKFKSPHLQDKSASPPKEEFDSSVSNVQSPKTNTKKTVIGPSRPPVTMSKQYPEDDPDYCVWVPPSGQTGDGRTHLNDKYGY
ncbi:kanadaptin-like isoform X2 [Sinocyclocheilus rhinocerous]|uniref:kanadaptin-like isoform X2 n=1 Tax=Sinocyclocheilus rhinocerous TaxID=307959 RepID=UPI0007B8D6A9|nr:PREDICTED: kanadaptin-like isoform X2 [Sinocyclocheilus rhinocerous]